MNLSRKPWRNSRSNSWRNFRGKSWRNIRPTVSAETKYPWTKSREIYEGASRDTPEVSTGEISEENPGKILNKKSIPRETLEDLLNKFQEQFGNKISEHPLELLQDNSQNNFKWTFCKKKNYKENPVVIIKKHQDEFSEKFQGEFHKKPLEIFRRNSMVILLQHCYKT